MFEMLTTDANKVLVVFQRCTSSCSMLVSCRWQSLKQKIKKVFMYADVNVTHL